MNLAPNGKKSNLTKVQYKLVRTDAFKKWFGDWEKKPKTASKVVDSNGEPMVVFHGTNAEFTVFDTDEESKNRKGGTWSAEYPNGYIFMISDIKRAKYYGKRIIPLFVNMKYPTIRKVKKGESLVLPFDDEGLAYEGDAIVTDGIEYVVGTQDEFQIKLADGTNTTFDANNNDIRYKNGGNMETEYKVMFESRSGSGNVREVRVMAKNFNDAKKKGWLKSGLNKKFYAFLTAHEIKALGGLMLIQMASTGYTLNQIANDKTPFIYNIGGL
jgi:hypothetical protein